MWRQSLTALPGDHDVWGSTAEAESIRIIHRALDAGINFVDTANVYNGGESERVVGKALKDRREEAVLATKVRSAMGDGPNDSGTNRLHVMRELEASLRRLGTNIIDLYFIHSPVTTPLVVAPFVQIRRVDELIDHRRGLRLVQA